MESKSEIIMIFSRIFLLVLLISLFTPQLGAGDRDQAASKVAETVSKMRRIKTELDGDLPQALKPLLVRLKHQLRDLIQLKLNENPDSITPEELQQQILDDLGQNGVSIGPPDEETLNKDFRNNVYTYGDIDAISISRPAGHRDLLAVKTTIGVCCGDDTSLYIFQRRSGRWDLILSQESNFYDDISGAQGQFSYEVSAGGNKDDFFVVVADINPWCTSNWQLIRYKVLRPGPTADRPKILLSDHHIIYLGNDPVYELKIESNTFTLTFRGDTDPKEEPDAKNDDDDDDGSPKDFALSYKVEGNKVTQISK